MDTHRKHNFSVKEQCDYHGLADRQIYRWLNPTVKREKQQVLISLQEEDPLDKWFRKFMEGSGDFELRHTPRRSYGSTELHAQLKGLVPRRVVQQKITDERRQANQHGRNALRAVCWNRPMLCWAMDDTHLFTEADGTKVWIHNIKDLGSQYILPPLTGKLLSGEQVAENLKVLFDRFGAPLILKRDNGSNLCAEEVNKVLRKYNVIALTSPAYYSQYNGSIEQANGLLKKRIGVLREKYGMQMNRKNARILADLAAHEENNSVKRSTGRRTPSYRFFGKTKQATNKLRKEVIEEITEKKKELTAGKVLTKREEKRINRKAVEAVLEKRSYIKVTQNEPVSPLF